MPSTALCPLNAAIELANDRSAQGLSHLPRRQRAKITASALGLLVFTPVTTFALELGEASVRSSLGQSLLVEIPYRLAENERLTPSCVALAPAAQGTDGLPTYTRASRISITSTHIEIFDNGRVREPLIGLSVDVHCDTAPHFVRSYQLFIDPPASIPQPSARTAAPLVAARSTDGIPSGTATTTVTSIPAASAAPPRANASPRARGEAGGNLTQGQTYRVVRGDTLSGIAARIAERPATIRETAEAIFAANATAFTRGNPDLIEAGRSITIPLMTPAPATLRAPSTPTPLPAAREPELPAAAPAPTALPPLPATTNVVELPAAPLPVATRTDVVSDAPGETTAGRTTGWLTALLTLGAAILLATPLAFVWRRKQQTADQARGKVQKSHPRQPVNPVAGIDVIEGRLAGAPPADPDVEPAADYGVTSPAGLADMPLRIGPTDAVDLDVGDVTIEENAATVRMQDIDAAVTALQQSHEPKADVLERTMADEKMRLTIVELDMLRQDYEAEHTLTQQGSQALRDAVADLKATQAARAATAEQTATLELPEQSPTETPYSAANSQTARLRK